MGFKKVTISIPTRMYKEKMFLVRKGLFSNFSDLVRSGIREELKDLRFLTNRKAELISINKELVKGVKEALEDVKHGRFNEFKNEKEMDALP